MSNLQKILNSLDINHPLDIPTIARKSGVYEMTVFDIICEETDWITWTSSRDGMGEILFIPGKSPFAA